MMSNLHVEHCITPDKLVCMGLLLSYTNIIANQKTAQGQFFDEIFRCNFVTSQICSVEQICLPTPARYRSLVLAIYLRPKNPLNKLRLFKRDFSSRFLYSLLQFHCFLFLHARLEHRWCCVHEILGFLQTKT